MRSILTSAVIALFAALPAVAEEAAKAAAPAKPTPPEEMAKLANMVGTWKCAGKMHLPPEMGGEQASQSRLTVKKDLDGFWLAVGFQIDKPKNFPGGKASMIWGFDPLEKKYVEHGFDSAGNWWRSTSDGVKDSKWVWDGEGVMMGKKTKMRVTVTEKNAKEVGVASEMEAEPGKWIAMGEDTCKK